MTMELLYTCTMAINNNILINLLIELFNLNIHILNITNLHCNSLLNIMEQHILLLCLVWASLSTYSLSGLLISMNFMIGQSCAELRSMTMLSMWSLLYWLRVPLHSGVITHVFAFSIMIGRTWSIWCTYMFFITRDYDWLAPLFYLLWVFVIL